MDIDETTGRPHSTSATCPECDTTQTFLSDERPSPCCGQNWGDPMPGEEEEEAQDVETLAEAISRQKHEFLCRYNIQPDTLLVGTLARDRLVAELKGMCPVETGSAGCEFIGQIRFDGMKVRTTADEDAKDSVMVGLLYHVNQKDNDEGSDDEHT